MEAVRNKPSVDWTLRENVRVNLRVLVKRILWRHGYLPNRQEKVTRIALERAEVLLAQWAGRQAVGGSDIRRLGATMGATY